MRRHRRVFKHRALEKRKVQFRFCKNAVNKTNCNEVGNENTENNLIDNGSLNQISQKFTLNKRQYIEF